MSGKKYKNCCINRQAFLEFCRNNLESQYIDGDYMINNLCQCSELLQRYLRETLKILNQPIIWLLNPNLNARM